MSADDTNGRPTGAVEYLVSATHDDDIRSLEKRLGQLSADVRLLSESINNKFARSESRDERIEDLILDMHARLDRALNALDGLDVRKRLAVVEEAVAERPRRRGARK